MGGAKRKKEAKNLHCKKDKYDMKKYCPTAFQKGCVAPMST